MSDVRQRTVETKLLHPGDIGQETEQKLRVAAYCRVSTQDEDQKESYEIQKVAYTDRIASEPGWEMVGIYADEGLSGTTVKGRAEFQRMFRDCADGKIDLILTKSISRFARNTLDCIEHVGILHGFGVHVCFEKEGIDTRNRTSDMVLTIMASFAQEESRNISENVKWGIRKRFENGIEVKVPLYGFYHTEDELFLIEPQEAEIVREIFTRYVHGELPQEIMNDMIRRGVKPPAGDCWKRLQLDRMLKNEKYAGDSILQKTFIENHLTHRQARNHGQLPKYEIRDAHPAIIDRHLFEQTQKIIAMRKVSNGNNSYPYGEMLRCPYCGNTLVHGSLNEFSCGGRKIKNGGWGCYGEGGCGKYLVIQNILDRAVLRAFAEKHGTEQKSVEFYWLDDLVKRIELSEDSVFIHWKDGTWSTAEMEFSDAYFKPSAYAVFYNGVLDRIHRGEKKNKYKYLMGLGRDQNE